MNPAPAAAPPRQVINQRRPALRGRSFCFRSTTEGESSCSGPYRRTTHGNRADGSSGNPISTIDENSSFFTMSV
ncbi:hypothetical protein ACFX13_003761 [Malus domestica]